MIKMGTYDVCLTLKQLPHTETAASHRNSCLTLKQLPHTETTASQRNICHALEQLPHTRTDTSFSHSSHRFPTSYSEASIHHQRRSAKAAAALNPLLIDFRV
jgi:hypothetical protein